MEKQSFFNTYCFLRRYFDIPKKRKLKWCIVKETTDSNTELRLGASVFGTEKYIDIAQRKIFSEISCDAIQRSVHPAKRTMDGLDFVYTTENGWTLRKPKSYIMDTYKSSWWGGSSANEKLL